MHRKLFNSFKNHGSNHESDKSSSSSGNTPPSLTPSSASERSDDEEGPEFHLDDSPLEIPDPIDGNGYPIDNAAELAALVAQYGHAPATAWLERERYRIWRPTDPVPSSSFLPIQGYLYAVDWVFAWGSPLVSDKAALKPTVMQFIAWVQSHKLRLVYCCVPEEIEELLADVGWCAISCISEDVIDPRHILEMTQDDDKGGHGSMVKDLKKNLRRAERANVEVKRISQQDWSDDLKREIEDGIGAWKSARSHARKPRLQLAATSFDPWLDIENREYWVALQHERMIGVLILTPAGDSYVIKNAAQFPDAPKGTSELLIHTVLRDLHEQHPKGIEDHNPGHLTVTFNISAASELKSRNISGLTFTGLSGLYASVAGSAKLMNRHDFRRKFDTFDQPMFVCYPTKEAGEFVLHGIRKLLKLLQR
ncbi:hypothetical protein OG21DRAFT_1514629 [Imleria badia]|nr:hypothetical protein OG21DRAFT_1514629 [Imleria badia]